MRSDFCVHELPSTDSQAKCTFDSSDRNVISEALLARIKVLEAENKKLREKQKERKYFRLEDIQHDDKLVSFYTGFVSFGILLSFSIF